MRIECPYCHKMVTTLFGNYGFSSCVDCYPEMIENLIKKYLKELLRIKEIESLEKEKKELVLKITNLEKKENKEVGI